MPERASIPRTDCAEVQLVLCNPHPEYAPQVANAARGSDIVVFDDTGSSPGEREMTAFGLYCLINRETFNALDPLDQKELTEHASQDLATATALALREEHNAGIGVDLVGMTNDDPESIIFTRERHAWDYYISLLSHLSCGSDLAAAKIQHLAARHASDTLNQSVIARQLTGLAAWCEGYSPRRITAVLGLGYAAVGALLQENNIATDMQEFRPAGDLSYGQQLLASLNGLDGNTNTPLLNRAILSDMSLCAMSIERRGLSPSERRTLHRLTFGAVQQMDDAGIAEILGRWDIIAKQDQPMGAKQKLLAQMLHDFGL